MTTATWKSKIPAVVAKLDAAMREGVEEAAIHYELAIRNVLRPGYTTGDWVTGALIASISRGPLVKTGNDYSMSVGSNLIYSLYWEMGHFSIYTHRFERQERWRPTYNRHRLAMLAIIQKHINRALTT